MRNQIFNVYAIDYSLTLVREIISATWQPCIERQIKCQIREITSRERTLIVIKITNNLFSLPKIPLK